MRKLMMIPLTLALGLGAASGAFAANASGEITQINPMTGWVTLDNGTAYDFKDLTSYQTKLDNFKVGDMVSVTYTTVGTGFDGNSIAPAN